VQDRLTRHPDLTARPPAMPTDPDATLPFPPPPLEWIEELLTGDGLTAPAGYAVERLLHRSPSTAVFMARSDFSTSRICLKWIAAGLAASPQMGVAKSAAHVAKAFEPWTKPIHPSLVRVLDVSQGNGGIWLAMEYVGGPRLCDVTARLAAQSEPAAMVTLKSLITARREATTPDTQGDQDTSARTPVVDELRLVADAQPEGEVYFALVCVWMKQLCGAVAAIHDAGLVHGDIKPANIVVADDLRLVLIDLDISEVAATSSTPSTYGSRATPRYTPPERIAAMASTLTGQPFSPAPPSNRWDTWGLGLVFFELLTFQPAFVGADARAVLSAIATTDPPSPRQLQWSVPKALEAICLRCLERNPASRTPDPRALIAQLQAYEHPAPRSLGQRWSDGVNNILQSLLGGARPSDRSGGVT